MASESTRPDPGLWYRIGYVVERARQARPVNVGDRTGGRPAAPPHTVRRAAAPGAASGTGAGIRAGLYGIGAALAGLEERRAARRGSGAEVGRAAAGIARGDPGEGHGNPGGGGGHASGRGPSEQELGGPGADWPTPEDLAATALAALVGRALGGGGRRRGVGVIGLLRAGLAGAASALLLDLLRPVLYGRGQEVGVEDEVADRVLAGAAQGLVYGAVVEPHFPGPPLLKGALFGSAEYATEASGGLGHLMRAHTPHGKVPGMSELVGRLRPKERAYLEHVLFGIALALLYGSSRSSNGIRIEVEAEE